MVRAFPPKVRFTGLSSSYNLAYAIFGGLTPVVVTLMMKTQPLAPAYYVAALCLLGLAVGFFLLRNDMQASESRSKLEAVEAT